MDKKYIDGIFHGLMVRLLTHSDNLEQCGTPGKLPAMCSNEVGAAHGQRVSSLHTAVAAAPLLECYSVAQFRVMISYWSDDCDLRTRLKKIKPVYLRARVSV